MVVEKLVIAHVILCNPQKIAERGGRRAEEVSKRKEIKEKERARNARSIPCHHSRLLLTLTS